MDGSETSQALSSQSRPTAFPSRPVGVPRTNPWRSPLIAALVLSLVGAWTHWGISRVVTKKLRSELETILDADLEALKLWMGQQRDRIGARTTAEHLRECVAALTTQALNARFEPATLRSLPELGEFQKCLSGDAAGDCEPLFALFDASGIVIAAEDGDLVGKRLSPAGFSTLAAAFSGTSMVTRPFLPGSLIQREAAGVGGEPTMLVCGPVRNEENSIIAVLAYAIAPDTDFTRILTVARMGDTGETYAFDSKGLMLSESRFEDQLRRIGLIPEDPESSAILRVEIRDPGCNLVEDETPALERSQQPLTRMAQSATAHNSGIDVEGYNDYRGVEVVGAWVWLEDHGFGVATEVDVTEAFETLRLIRQTFIALFGILVLGAGALVLSMRSIRRLQRKVDVVRRLGQYTLEEKIGEGGMGKVYRARHAMLRRPTAVKILKPQDVTEESIGRFEREVQLTSMLTHPNTIAIYDYGRTPLGLFYYVMEYLSGVNLKELVDYAGPLPASRVIHIMTQACGSLEEAHLAGLIHRDIKPLNILLCERGASADVVKVLDFGLVKDIQSPKDTQLTAPNVVTGTPNYVSPEGLRSPEGVDARSDLYSLGAVAFFLLTGREVFAGENVFDICNAVLNTAPPRPSSVSAHSIPSDLESLVVACLDKAPGRRPQSARDLFNALSNCRDSGAWNREEALQWWGSHRQGLMGSSSDASQSPTPFSTGKEGSSLAVDLRDRLDA